MARQIRYPEGAGVPRDRPLGLCVGGRALTPQSVNLVLKRRCSQAGLDSADFAAHGLRSGYLAEAARKGVALPEAMQQFRHRSVQQAASYYNEAAQAQGRTVRLYDIQG